MRKIIPAEENRSHHFLYHLFAADKAEHPAPATLAKQLIRIVRENLLRNQNDQGEPTWKEKD